MKSKSKVLGSLLFGLTAALIVAYPALSKREANNSGPEGGRPIVDTLIGHQKPVVEVAFVLDTTGSMGGLIAAAKEKIWSIANSMAQADPAPEIRIGLVAYRDRGDQYVTQVFDLTDDLDSIYGTLMDFAADGGGDGPESVNQALYDAVNSLSWGNDGQAYRTIFLVGDAPPHMDYNNEQKYPTILSEARKRGIRVNTIQCGTMAETAATWQKIAKLGQGSYFQVEQAGNAVAIATPFDDRIATLSEKLDATRLFFGDKAEKAAMELKRKATDKLHSAASAASRARRAAFNLTESGERNLLGDNELVEAVSSGRLELDDVDTETLPATMQAMSPKERKDMIKEYAELRRELSAELSDLAQRRDRFLTDEVKKSGGAKDSLDQLLYDAVAEQASEVGIEYEDGPRY